MQHRSLQKEILDLGPEYYTLDEYHHCQKILFRINKLLGIFSNTKRILKKFAANARVLDVGCGGGLFILRLSQYFRNMQFIGADIAEDAIEIAKKELAILQNENIYNKINVSFHLQKNNSLQMPAESVDVILLTLVCHHLPDEELINFIPQLLTYTRKLIVIHDLQRHVIPMIFYKIFSPLFRNRLISHDGLISIQRGFTRAELKKILIQAGITNFQIKWYFPFRWRVLIWKN